MTRTRLKLGFDNYSIRALNWTSSSETLAFPLTQ